MVDEMIEDRKLEPVVLNENRPHCQEHNFSLEIQAFQVEMYNVLLELQALNNWVHVILRLIF